MAIALSPPTLGSLLSDVRDLLNQPDASNSFWSDSSLTNYINEGVRIYYAEVVQNMEGQWGKNASLDIVSGVETVNLPSDCYEVKGVWKVISSGRVPLPYQNNISDGVLTSGGGSGSESYFPAYSFQENKLKLNPVPDYSETGGLYLEYVYLPEVLLNPGDTMSANVVPLFKHVVVMYAVYKAKVKESLVSGANTAALALDNFNKIYQQFSESIKPRSKGPTFVKPFNPEG
jgi:hypothetical protein